MEEHFKALSAVFPIIGRIHNSQKQILLLQRANTGYMDGMWDFAGSGHVDENETATEAVIRECKEEIGITVESGDVHFAHLSHRLGLNGAPTYYDMYFMVDNFKDEPYIAEPHKCSGLQWFDINKLPCDMIHIRRDALLYYFESIYYSEVIIDAIEPKISYQ